MGTHVRFSWHLALPLSVAFATAACGPSFEVMRQNSIRFEHCNRLDWDQRISDDARATCWEDWRLHYSKGQTRDRIQWADNRIASIRQSRSSNPLSPSNDVASAQAGSGSGLAQQPPVEHRGFVASP